MNHRAVLVTGLDHNYFPFLRDLLFSFQACGAFDLCDFAILDAGLQPDEVAWLNRFGVSRIIQPDWPFEGLTEQPAWAKTMFCRPFYPEYFPEYRVIVHIDPDSWLQSDEALRQAIAAAEEDGFATIPLVDRSYWPLQGKAHTLVAMHWHKQCLADCYGQEIADRFQLFPVIMAGFFAGRRDAPHWLAWRELLSKGLKNNPRFGVDQASLTLMVHQSGLPVHFLPHYYYWVCHRGAIGIDTLSCQYVEPYRPHQPIASLGLTAHAKSEPMLVRTIDGRILSRSLRYGRQHQAYPVSIGFEGAPQQFDGIAHSRFRDQVFIALSKQGVVRFLQIGAMDGKLGDPIRQFVIRYGWHGTLVEPLPDMMARLKANYADQADRLSFVQCAITEQSGKVVMTRVRADAAQLPDWAVSLSSLLPERTMLAGRRLSPEQYSAIRAATVSEQVDALSFNDLVAQQGIDSFDLLVLDTEGYDYRILDQIDLHRHAPQCVLMEIINLPAEEIRQSIAKLHAAEFTCYAMSEGKDLLAVQRAFLQRHFGQP